MMTTKAGRTGSTCNIVFHPTKIQSKWTVANILIAKNIRPTFAHPGDSLHWCLVLFVSLKFPIISLVRLFIKNDQFVSESAGAHLWSGLQFIVSHHGHSQSELKHPQLVFEVV